MTEAKPPEKILELIRKLLALSTSSNENEAAAAAAKAQELLLKYNLEMSHVQSKEDDGVTRQNFETPYFDGWLSFLMNSIASTHMCSVVQGKGWKNGYRNGAAFIPGKEVREFYIFGKAANIEVVEYLYEYLAGEIDRLTPKGKPARYVTGFRNGAVSTIYKRLKDELKAFQGTPETTSLIVVNDAAVQARVKVDFPKLGKGRSSKVDLYGYLDGKAAGESIALRKGVGSTNSAGQSLLS